jgi:hypothetical protein
MNTFNPRIDQRKKSNSQTPREIEQERHRAAMEATGAAPHCHGGHESTRGFAAPRRVYGLSCSVCERSGTIRDIKGALIPCPRCNPQE